jgi:hypothetical protein
VTLIVNILHIYFLMYFIKSYLATVASCVVTCMPATDAAQINILEIEKYSKKPKMSLRPFFTFCRQARLDNNPTH